MSSPRLRGTFRVLLAVVMIGAGMAHLVAPDGFVQIVPKFLHAPLALVIVSGVFEILGGVGLLVPPVRRAASLGLVALYFAVFPANLNMALNDIQPDGAHVPVALLWFRLPLQIVFIAWAVWVGRREPGEPPEPDE
ncbi:MAG: DoxX family protein [Polyangiaceae bacterium]